MGSVRSSVVLVTGFGPFGSHKINSSSEAAKELKKMGLGMQNIQLVVVEEIPVLYDHVDKVLPELLRKYEPVLVINVGLSSAAKVLTLEQFANLSGYNRQDNDGKWPADEKCKIIHSVFPGADPKQKLQSVIKMDKVVMCLEDDNIQACVSDDAGMFLCDYIYCTSMACMKYMNKPLTNAFLHVPPLHKPYNAHELALQIRAAIRAMLQQIEERQIVTL